MQTLVIFQGKIFFFPEKNVFRWMITIDSINGKILFYLDLKILRIDAKRKTCFRPLFFHFSLNLYKKYIDFFFSLYSSTEITSITFYFLYKNHKVFFFLFLKRKIIMFLRYKECTMPNSYFIFRFNRF